MGTASEPQHALPSEDTAHLASRYPWQSSQTIYSHFTPHCHGGVLLAPAGHGATCWGSSGTVGSGPDSDRVGREIRAATRGSLVISVWTTHVGMSTYMKILGRCSTWEGTQQCCRLLSSLEPLRVVEGALPDLTPVVCPLCLTCTSIISCGFHYSMTWCPQCTESPLCVMTGFGTTQHAGGRWLGKAVPWGMPPLVALLWL